VKYFTFTERKRQPSLSKDLERRGEKETNTGKRTKPSTKKKKGKGGGSNSRQWGGKSQNLFLKRNSFAIQGQKGRGLRSFSNKEWRRPRWSGLFLSNRREEIGLSETILRKKRGGTLEDTLRLVALPGKSREKKNKTTGKKRKEEKIGKYSSEVLGEEDKYHFFRRTRRRKKQPRRGEEILPTRGSREV